MFALVFSSLIFIFGFLPVTLFVYYVSPNLKTKNIVLTILSLFFYAWGEPVWVVLLILTSIVDYINGVIIGKNLGKWQAKAALGVSLTVNLGLLVTFKYTDFFISNINFFSGAHIPLWNVALPIGISFFTFQTLSYSIDVYRGKVEYQRKFDDFLMFVALFPELVAGPILRYADIAEQIRYREHTVERFASGINRFVIGLSKKVLIANYTGKVATSLLDGNIANLSVLESWFGILMFAFQIYFDFSGYSDMAIGLARMFGFEYKENFNYPYISTSITDFWRRWHISLSSFFKDYVYIPLGGNRKFQIRNIIIVWFLTGFWHGASWNFIFWGLYFAVILIFEKIFMLEFLKKVPVVFARIYALFLILFGWTLFYFVDINRLLLFIKSMFGFNSLPFFTDKASLIIVNNSALVVIAIIASLPVAKYVKPFINKMFEGTEKQRTYAGIATAAFNTVFFIGSSIALIGTSYNPFIYFRF
jgi:alginate O-acetyltransferase complex protein AlgI